MGFFYSTWAIWAMVAIYILHALPGEPVTPAPPTTKGTIRPRATLAKPKEDQLSYKVFKLKTNKGKHKNSKIDSRKKQKRNAIDVENYFRNSEIQQLKVIHDIKPVAKLLKKTLEINIENNSTTTMKSMLKVLHLNSSSEWQKNMEETRKDNRDKNSIKSQFKVGLKRNLKSKKSILPKVPSSWDAAISKVLLPNNIVDVKNTIKSKSRVEKQVLMVTNSSKKHVETDMALRKSKWLSYIRNSRKYTTDKSIIYSTNKVTQSKKNVDSTAAHQTKRSIFDNLNSSRVIPINENITSSTKGHEKFKFDLYDQTDEMLILDLWTYPSVAKKQTTDRSVTTKKHNTSRAITENYLPDEILSTESLEETTRKPAMIQKIPMRLILKRIARGKPKPMYSKKIRKQGLQYQNKIILNANAIKFMPNKIYPTVKRRNSMLPLKKHDIILKLQPILLSKMKIGDELVLKRYRDNGVAFGFKNKLYKINSERRSYF